MTGSGEWFATFAGALHFVQLPSLMIASRELRWDEQLRQLDTFGRQLALAFGGGITACVLGLGGIVLSGHGVLLDDSTGLRLCVFLSLFWLARGAAQWRVFGATWPTRLRWMHRGLCVLYPTIGLLYGASVISHM